MVPPPLRAGSFAVVLSAVALASSLLVTAPVSAADRLTQMSGELENNEDFRVRTQAALSLGATKDKRAVAPLCAGLDDPTTTVRAAAAAALGKLALGGADCLKARLESETNPAVRSVIQKSLDGQKGAARSAGVGPETKYYVAVGPTTDKTGREGNAVDDLIRSSITTAAASLEGCLLAPRDEKPAAAKALTGKFKKLKAFFLWPKVLPPDYASGNLTVKFEVAVFTYPGKALKGTIPLKLTMPDVRPGDVASENDLIRQAAGSAFQRFADNAERFAR